jgi:lipopolysaccharide export system protein LptA
MQRCKSEKYKYITGQIQLHNQTMQVHAPKAIIILDHQKNNACEDARVKNINTLLDKSSFTTKQCKFTIQSVDECGSG